MDQLREPPSVSWTAHVKHRLQLLNEMPTLRLTGCRSPSWTSCRNWPAKPNRSRRRLRTLGSNGELRRVSYGLQKRLDLWRAVWRAEQPAVRDAAASTPPPGLRTYWARLLQSVASYPPDNDDGRDWCIVPGNPAADGIGRRRESGAVGGHRHRAICAATNSGRGAFRRAKRIS